jgi:hypothetical protein
LQEIIRAAEETLFRSAIEWGCTPSVKAMFQMIVFADYADSAVMRSPTSDAERAVAQSIDAA